MKAEDVRALAIELRDEFAFAANSPARLFDEGAEALLLAAAFDGYWPKEPVAPGDYFFALHQDVAEVLEAAHEIDIEPTLRSVVRGVEALGASGPHLESAIERLFHDTATVANVDDVARRVRQLAWRRRMVGALDRLRAKLLEPAIAETEIEAGVDALVEVATMGSMEPMPSSKRRVA